MTYYHNNTIKVYLIVEDLKIMDYTILNNVGATVLIGSGWEGIKPKLRASTKQSCSEEKEEFGFEFESLKRKSLILVSFRLGL